jgi:uncharacterized hydrophobic protein (TIGR00271 family)
MTQDASKTVPHDATTDDSTPNRIATDTSLNTDAINADSINADASDSAVFTKVAEEATAESVDDIKPAPDKDTDETSEADTTVDDTALDTAATGSGNGVAQMPEPKIIITEESPDVVVAEVISDPAAEEDVKAEGSVTIERSVGTENSAAVASETNESVDELAAKQAELESVAQLAEAELAANGLEDEEEIEEDAQQTSDSSDATNDPSLTNDPSSVNSSDAVSEHAEGTVIEVAGISAKPIRNNEPTVAPVDNASSAPIASESQPATDNTADTPTEYKEKYIQQELAKQQDPDIKNNKDNEDTDADDDADEEETPEEREQRKREEKLESYKQFLAQQESEQKIDYSKVRVSIEANALPSKMYFLMNALSAIIASYGLVANSPAVVIGAMLVAMMLGPITGVALAIIDYRMPLLRKSLFTVAAGGALVVAIGFIVGLLHQGQPLTNEILSRTEPTSMDLMIALAGGTAGAYAMISPHLSVAVVGVAVATALVPPLAASGILLSNGEISLGLGALLLAMTNIIAIQFTNALVLWFTGFRRLVDDDYKSGTYLTFFRRNAVTLLLLIGLGIYLTLNLNTIAKQQQFETNVKTNINDYFIDKGNVLTNTQFEKYDGYQTIRAVVRGETVPNSYDVRQIEAKITEDMDENFPKYLPVKLQLRYLPIKVIEANPLITEKLDETDAAILNN